MENLTKVNKKNTINLAVWTFMWLLGTALSTFGPILLWDDKLYTAGSIILTIVIGAFMLMANVRYMNGLDELQRKIQLEAFSWALGVGVVIGLAYAQMGSNDLVSNTGQIPFLVMFMSISYIVALLIGNYRYK